MLVHWVAWDRQAAWQATLAEELWSQMDLVNLECDDEVIPSTSTIIGKMPAASANALSMAETTSTFEDLHFSSAMFFSPPFVYDLIIFNLSDHIEFLFGVAASFCITLATVELRPLQTDKQAGQKMLKTFWGKNVRALA